MHGFQAHAYQTSEDGLPDDAMKTMRANVAREMSALSTAMSSHGTHKLSAHSLRSALAVIFKDSDEETRQMFVSDTQQSDVTEALRLIQKHIKLPMPRPICNLVTHTCSTPKCGRRSHIIAEEEEIFCQAGGATLLDCVALDDLHDTLEKKCDACNKNTEHSSSLCYPAKTTVDTIFGLYQHETTAGESAGQTEAVSSSLPIGDGQTEAVIFARRMADLRNLPLTTLQSCEHI